MRELAELLKCPVDWDKETLDDDWDWSLPKLDWHYSLEESIEEGSDIPIRSEDFDFLEEDKEDLRQLKISLRLRRPMAVELYMKRAGRLSGLHFMTPAEHGKHFVPWVKREDVAARSRGGPSLFAINYDNVRFRRGFWSWFRLYFENVWSTVQYWWLVEPEEDLYDTPQGVLWRRFLNEPHLRIYMNTIREVGASDGEMTSFLCYDIHIDSKTVHCYPVSEIEGKQQMGADEVIMNDGFNC